MSGSSNKVMLIGNLGADPDIRQLSNGKVVTLAIATSERWKDKTTGERRERTDWHRVVIYNTHLCEVAEKYLHKGSKVAVEGALRNRKFTDKTGAERYTTEVVLGPYNADLTLLDPKPAATPDHAPSDIPASTTKPSIEQTADDSSEMLDNPIPWET